MSYNPVLDLPKSQMYRDMTALGIYDLDNGKAISSSTSPMIPTAARSSAAPAGVRLGSPRASSASTPFRRASGEASGLGGIPRDAGECIRRARELLPAHLTVELEEAAG